MTLRTYPLFLLSCALLSGAAAQSTSGTASAVQVDKTFLATEAERLSSAIAEAVTAVGGDLDRQHVHLVFAFSTGHFAKDPRMAEAARVVASDVAEQTLVNGDQLSSYAWEMSVWPHKGQALNPFQVGEDRSALRASFQDLWPRSVQAGSRGGHDTEAAIAQITGDLGESTNAVVVLLTNTAASVVGERDQQTIGENDPGYLSALERWNRVKTSATTGATLQLQVDPDRPGRTFDAVIVVPQAFRGEALDASRADLVRAVAGEAPLTEQDTPAGNRWLLPALVLLGGAGLAAFFLTRRRSAGGAGGGRSAARGTWELQIAGRSFPVQSVPEGEPVCIICGPGYPAPPSNPGYVLLSGVDLPPVKLLTIRRTGSALTLQPDLDVTLEDGTPPSFPAGKDADYTINLKGRAATKPHLPPRPFKATVNLAVRPQEN
ncbi:hypothetical protein F8S09_13825 [Deinococcus sp. SDU3-2]|uniref:VWA domain-containing protein n=1 Tax=Deinococcus terrestris TaxID=2651870 RepID=A0A7X1NXU5_9DEIO|nr:hypothetical protein [Deinococcus terrestris]MPY67689.1 hypothetical protein [Deinococcus terrestris]MPY67745.1 hypothetical protein [Deinococcus terrestris]